MSNKFDNVFKAAEELNTEASILSNALSLVSEYIDTGSYALNAIISGSVYRGIPKGRITGLVGPTGCGKSLILNKIIASAQKKDPEVWGVIWDSEGASDPAMARSVGANPDKIKYFPIETVEDCRNQITAFLDKVLEDKSLHGKFVVGIDSLGNLASNKELEDAKAGKVATDMGTRAKTIKSMMRTLTGKCSKTNTTLVFTNHIYDDPMSMFPSLVKNQSGGKGPMYLASLLIQLAVKPEKQEKTEGEMIPMANRIAGVTMRALTVKNRFVPPFLETEMYLNFKTGLYKYAGLLEMALAYGIVKQSGSTYTIGDTKLGYLKNWKDDPELWENQIIPALDKIIIKEFTFSTDELLETNNVTEEK